MLRPAPLSDTLLTPRLRLLRFALVGGTAALLQLATLDALELAGLGPILSEVAAFLLAAQLNFGLSWVFTWADRAAGQSFVRRWAAFHGAISGTALLNFAIFTATQGVLPHPVAAALGIGGAALINFAVGDHLVFRGGRPKEAAVGLLLPARAEMVD